MYAVLLGFDGELDVRIDAVDVFSEVSSTSCS